MDTKLTTSVRFEPDLLELIDLFAGSKQWSRNKAINVLLGQALSGSPEPMAEGAPLRGHREGTAAAAERPTDSKPPPPSLKPKLLGAPGKECAHPRSKQTKLAHNRWQCECGAILQTNGRVVRP